MDGGGHYDSAGITFSNQTFYAYDSRFNLAGPNDRGITPGSNNSIMTVHFTGGVSEVTFGWVALNAFEARAFDAGGNLIDSFADAGATQRGGFATFSGIGTIDRITFADAIGTVGLPFSVGVGYLEFEPELAAIPLPSAAGIGLAGFGLLALRRRR